MKSSKAKGFLQLMRPANVVTAIADVLAGIAISGIMTERNSSWDTIMPVLFLCISTAGLYAGGIVFNDVFDADLDAVERPERPIPKGIITKKEASLQGIILLLIGVSFAFLTGSIPGIIAVSIAIAALIYDKWGKHHSLAGPLNMGLCRGLNLLLGISIVNVALYAWWVIAFVPIIYIAAITMISRGEVNGGDRKILLFSGLLYVVVIAGILFFSSGEGSGIWPVVFLIPFAAMIFPKLFKAIRNPVPQNIGKAVKAGVIALILMNAAWAASFGVLPLAFVIILLLPLSLWLAKAFAVT